MSGLNSDKVACAAGTFPQLGVPWLFTCFFVSESNDSRSMTCRDCDGMDKRSDTSVIQRHDSALLDMICAMPSHICVAPGPYS